MYIHMCMHAIENMPFVHYSNSKSNCTYVSYPNACVNHIWNITYKTKDLIALSLFPIKLFSLFFCDVLMDEKHDLKDILFQC